MTAVPHPITVYLAYGEVVAAHAPDDRELLLRRLVNENLISTQYAGALLGERITFGSVLEELFGSVEPEQLDQALLQRFEDNVARYLGGHGGVHFQELDAVFVDNLQMGIDAMDLLVRAREKWNLAKALDLEEELIVGDQPPEDAVQRLVLSHLGQGRSGLALLRTLPMEPVAAAAVVMRMLQEDILLYRSAWEEEDDEDFATEEVDRAEVLDRTRAQAPTPPPMPERADPTSALASDIDIDGAGDLTSYDAWLNHGEANEIDLDAFADHESDRGETAGGGGFSSESHNLDRVELVPGEELDPIELDEADDSKVDLTQAQSLSFSAPKLSEEDASAKIDVASDVLRAVVQQMDGEEGAGRGQAMVRLLLEGSPTEYLEFFRKAEPERDGTLPTARLLANLRNKPPSEHRRFLNKALEDLIERALSQTMDELSDDAVDTVLEQAAGYRQRLGL